MGALFDEKRETPTVPVNNREYPTVGYRTIQELFGKTASTDVKPNNTEGSR